MTFDIINPESLGAPKGWSHGMLAPAGGGGGGRLLFVAGQDAADASGVVAESGFVEQFSRVLEKVLIVVRESGGGPEDIGRLTIFVSDIEAYLDSRKPLGEAYRRLMGRHYPAMALVEVKRLMDPNALVEIEATAVIS